jgi:hypothetical protein
MRPTELKTESHTLHTTQPMHCRPLTRLFTFPITFVGHPCSKSLRVMDGRSCNDACSTLHHRWHLHIRQLYLVHTGCGLVRVTGIQRSLRGPTDLPNAGVLMFKPTFTNTYTPRTISSFRSLPLHDVTTVRCLLQINCSTCRN